MASGLHGFTRILPGWIESMEWKQQANVRIEKVKVAVLVFHLQARWEKRAGAESFQITQQKEEETLRIISCCMHCKLEL